MPADLGALPWPDPATWVGPHGGSPLVGDDRPLHLEGTTLYLDRLWADERLVAADLRERSGGAAPAGVDAELLRDGLAELFPGTTIPTSSAWRRPPPSCGGCR